LINRHAKGILAILCAALFLVVQPAFAKSSPQKDFAAAEKAYAKENYKSAKPKYEKACAGGISEACFTLARMYELGQGAPEDESKERFYYAKSCDLGDVFGCNNAGAMADDGEGGPSNYLDAKDYYQKACNGGRYIACHNLGLMAIRGTYSSSGEASIPLALKIWETNCNNAYARSCYRIGNIYEKGEGGPVNLVRTRIYYAKACDGEMWDVCNNLGAMYDDGEGGKVDHVKARALFEMACEKGLAKGCANLGTMHSSGKGGATDYVKARDYLRQGCVLEGEDYDAADCRKYATALTLSDPGPVDLEGARTILSKGCQGGHANSCDDLADLLRLIKDGPAATETANLTLSEMRNIYAGGCDQNDLEACYKLAMLHYAGEGGPVDHASARKLFGKSCSDTFTKGCHYFGFMNEFGEGGPVNFMVARAVYSKACNTDDNQACWRLGQMNARGEGGPINVQRAIMLYKKACDKGEENACKSLADIT
jgi:uncharacterized protein